MSSDERERGEVLTEEQYREAVRFLRGRRGTEEGRRSVRYDLLAHDAALRARIEELWEVLEGADVVEDDGDWLLTLRFEGEAAITARQALNRRGESDADD